MLITGVGARPSSAPNGTEHSHPSVPVHGGEQRHRLNMFLLPVLLLTLRSIPHWHGPPEEDNLKAYI
ncbi:hypothetical protein [Paenibacillus taichungensis]|uniref:hypothetical protein n=1 Tax=Paenibacillus taichungensis TaxID=484184 RepID=UPI0039A565E1